MILSKPVVLGYHGCDLKIAEGLINGFKEPNPSENKNGDKLYSRFLDYAVFEILHTLRYEKGEPEFDTVRAFFVEGQEIYPTAGLRSLDHVQICVRNTKNILGFFLLRARQPQTA